MPAALRQVLAVARPSPSLPSAEVHLTMYGE